MTGYFDISTLNWVKGEIEETLKQARIALEKYSENPEDEAQIQFCGVHLHQVAGTLEMVELFGAGQFAAEMERLADVLPKLDSRQSALELLMRTILLLPEYLEVLQSGQPDSPVILLPLINELRRARGEKDLNAAAVFQPSLGVEPPRAGAPITDMGDLAHKLRPHYQAALVNILKGAEVVPGAKIVEAVFEKLRHGSASTVLRRAFWVGAALGEALREGGLPLDAPIKQLLGKFDQVIKQVGAAGIQGFDSSALDPLVRASLFEVARATSTGRLVTEIRRAFRLDALLPAPILLEQIRSGMGGFNAELKKTVSRDIMEELSRIKDVLDLFSRIPERSATELTPIATALTHIAEVLALLRQAPLGDKLRLQVAQIEQVVRNAPAPAEESLLMGVAESVLSVEGVLSDWGAVGHLEKADDETGQLKQEETTPEGEAEHRRIIRQVMKEAKDDLLKAREAINSYVQRPTETSLGDVPRLMTQIIGSLSMLSYQRVAQVLRACRSFIEEQLSESTKLPPAPKLDALADAMMSVEYYLDAFVESRVHPSSVLDVAERAVASLGYPVDSLAEESSETILVAAPDDALEDNELDLEFEVPFGWDLHAEVEPDMPEKEKGLEWMLPAQAAEISTELAVVSAHPPVSTAPAISAAPVEVDEEIIEIFMEEAEEELQKIGEFLSRWKADTADGEALRDLRRCFHTLKGSGRLVGAKVLGEFAWAFESLLNRVIDGTVQLSGAVFDIIERSRLTLPELFEQFRGGTAPTSDFIALQEEASAFAQFGIAPVMVADAPSQLAQPDSTDTTFEIADPILRDIYTKEAEAHVASLNAFLANCRLSRCRVNDVLVRALHTLCGSSRTAGVSGIAELCSILEKYAKYRQASGIPLEPQALSLLNDTAAYVVSVIKTLRGERVASALGELPARAAQLLEEAEAERHAEKVELHEKKTQVVESSQILSFSDTEDVKAFGAAEPPWGDFSLDSDVSDQPLELSFLTDEPLVEGAGLDATPQSEVEFGQRGSDLAFGNEIFVESASELGDPVEDLAFGNDLLVESASELGHPAEDLAFGNELLVEPESEPGHSVEDLAFGNELLVEPESELGRPVEGLVFGNEPLMEFELLDEESLPEDLLLYEEAPALADNGALKFSLLDELSPDWDTNTGTFGEPEASSVSPLHVQEAAAAESAPFVSLISDLDSELFGDRASLVVTAESDVSGVVTEYAKPAALVSDVDEKLAGETFSREVGAEPNLGGDASAHEVIFDPLPGSQGVGSLDAEKEAGTWSLVGEELETLAGGEESFAGWDLSGEVEQPREELLAFEEGFERSLDAVQASASTSMVSAPVPVATREIPELLDVYAKEAGDLLNASDELLRDLKEHPEERLSAEALQRVLHTLKGSARWAGVTLMADLGHELESAYAGVVAGRLAVTTEFLQVAQFTHSHLKTLLNELKGGAKTTGTEDLMEKLRGLATARSSVSPTRAPQPVRDYDPELLSIFLEEGLELLNASDESLQAWIATPQNKRIVENLQRHLHTLKGGARMAGVSEIGDLGHSLESMLASVADGILESSPRMFGLLQRAQDRLAVMLEQLRHNDPIPSGDDLIADIEALVSGKENQPTSSSHDEESVEEPIAEDESGGVAASPAVEVATVRTVELREGTGAATVESELDSDGQERRQGARAQYELVRVRSDLLDSMVNVAGEASIFRSRVEQQIGDFRINLTELNQIVERLRERLRLFDIETEAQIQSRFEEAQRYEEFDPLEFDRFTNMQQFSRSMVESLGDLGSIGSTLQGLTRETETLLVQQARVNTELQEGLMHTRMVPLVQHAPRMRRIARQTCETLGKEAELRFKGAEVEMDRNVVERIMAPLEHLLRNAVAHGIESPTVREASGKPRSGTIVIQQQREGTEVVVRVTDDGAGIDITAVREKAIARGLLDPDAHLPDREILLFILESGFSTAQALTQIAGRGVGMDVVNSEVKNLNGSLTIESEKGKGTSFTIRLPMTLTVSRALLVYVGDDMYAVPLLSIEGIVRASDEEIDELLATDPPVYQWLGVGYDVLHLATVLGIDSSAKENEGRRQSVLLASSGGHKVALVVDGLLGSREIVVKPVGRQLGTLRGISGATILGDGRVALILELPGLVRMGLARRSERERPREIEAVAAPINKPTIMVVDDSITVRKVTSRLLERNDMNSVSAKDGMEAVSMLQDIVPDVMLLDIEMPRMDGYELATHVRNEPRLRDVPIIMITSRSGEKHRQRAMQIGVNIYMTKPFQENELLDNIRTLLRERRPRAAKAR